MTWKLENQQRIELHGAQFCWVDSCKRNLEISLCPRWEKVIWASWRWKQYSEELNRIEVANFIELEFRRDKNKMTPRERRMWIIIKCSITLNIMAPLGFDSFSSGFHSTKSQFSLNKARPRNSLGNWIRRFGPLYIYVGKNLYLGKIAKRWTCFIGSQEGSEQKNKCN